MKTFSVFLAVVLLMVACSDKDNDYVTPSACLLKATVVQTRNMDCGKPVLLFEDTSAIKQIAGYNMSGLCMVHMLPDSLNVMNKKLLVCIAPLRREDGFICLAMGPAYPAVTLVSAEARD